MKTKKRILLMARVRRQINQWDECPESITECSARVVLGGVHALCRSVGHACCKYCRPVIGGGEGEGDVRGLGSPRYSRLGSLRYKNVRSLRYKVCGTEFRNSAAQGVRRLLYKI